MPCANIQSASGQMRRHTDRLRKISKGASCGFFQKTGNGALAVFGFDLVNQIAVKGQVHAAFLAGNRHRDRNSPDFGGFRFWIGRQGFEGGRGGDIVAVFVHAINMKGQGFFGHFHEVNHIVTDGHAAGKIGEHCPVSGILIVLVNDGPIGLFHRSVAFASCGVMDGGSCLSQLHPGLFLDTSERFDRRILFGMRDGNAPGFAWVFKLMVTAFDIHKKPSVSLKRLDDRSAVHALRFRCSWSYYAHMLYNRQGINTAYAHKNDEKIGPFIRGEQKKARTWQIVTGLTCHSVDLFSGSGGVA